ncbi:acyltransferase domain-containing protein [Marinivivus vitaminiproducens]|uniref:acyltransferase domain-containing protein n=1 Tax=Marinivivus vitaminiproducens TaxID=3035935 RepID=UPI00279EF252|nr:acyltransferase domain-containing protein [Geminicoccaceae bacterium SCSIO 64248]
MPRTIMMFCGQGAQYYQMGREFYRENAIYRQAIDRCDAICKALGARPVSDIVYSRPLGESEHFDHLTESNVALLSVEYALAMVMFDRGVQPERLLGYSLGETVAAVVGGVLALEDGLRLVHGQAELLRRLGTPGGMVAALADHGRVRRCVGDYAEIAAVNAPAHCVVSTVAATIPATCDALEREGVIWARLPIRYPFHASPLEPMAEPMLRFLSDFRYEVPRLPIVSAATGGIVGRFDAAHVWSVMRERLCFDETLRRLAVEGDWVLVEAGPSGTLASFTRQARLDGVTAWPAIDQFGQNAKTMDKLTAAAT